MKISIKEAFKIAKDALPGYIVSVEAKIGNAYSSKQDEEIRWEIRCQKEKSKASTISEEDTIFSIALAKVVAEVTRRRKKPAEDVDVNQDGSEAKEPVQDEEKDDGEEVEEKRDELSF